MEYKLIWSDEALDDLRQLVSYIARRDQRIARRFGKALLARVGMLATHPELGRPLPENHAFRHLVHQPFRIVYRIDPKAHSVFIYRLWHAARGEPPV